MNWRFLVGLAAVSACLVSGCGPVEMRYTLNAELEDELKGQGVELTDAARTQLADALDEVFGTPREPKIPEGVTEAGVIHDPQQLAAGAASYRRLCMHCHGLSGDGRGPTAGPKEHPWLNPRPRDYRRGEFKFTSTDGNTQKPTRADLVRTLKNGVPGTSMPSFALYKDPVIENIVDYVILLSIRGQTERLTAADFEPATPIKAEAAAENAANVAGQWRGLEKRVVTPKAPPPPVDDKESLARGKALFMKTEVQCFNCHGPEARGDGLERGGVPSTIKNTDNWGDKLKPADLTLGVYRGGGRPIDLFRRMHAGIKGGRMPAQGINLKEEQIWDLVNYVRMLPYLTEEPKVAQTSSGGHESDAKHN